MHYYFSFFSELSCVCDLACGWIVMLDDETQKESFFFFGESWQIRADRQRKKKALGLSDEE